MFIAAYPVPCRLRDVLANLRERMFGEDNSRIKLVRRLGSES